MMTAAVLYVLAAVSSSRRYKPWPVSRTIFWLTGPLARLAHHDFAAHMAGHLLLGMLAPLLIILAAPMTLMMRTLPTTLARRLVRVMKSGPARVLGDPLAASLLNVGGLWVLYATGLYAAMHHHHLLHALIHLHVFLAGCLFTVSMISIDPAPHRTSFLYRSIVLVIALAGHGILSKYIYAHPPLSVPAAQAEAGGMLMYYGGDAVDAVLICIFCAQWYRAVQTKTPHA